jgi:pyruvate/2-oxoglutarate dehydrogenase complex dihydrolipoamide acyltransferase (E2) component
MNISTFYRLTKSPDGSQPVEKVVVARDGTRAFEKQGKIVAKDLTEFRKKYPGTKVEGAPTEQNMALDLANMTDEQLLAMGVQRAVVVDTSPTGDIAFASPAAADMAREYNLSPEDFFAIKGSGRDGKFTSPDIRAILDARV